MFIHPLNILRFESQHQNTFQYEKGNLFCFHDYCGFDRKSKHFQKYKCYAFTIIVKRNHAWLSSIQMVWFSWWLRLNLMYKSLNGNDRPFTEIYRFLSVVSYFLNIHSTKETWCLKRTTWDTKRGQWYVSAYLSEVSISFFFFYHIYFENTRLSLQKLARIFFLELSR